MSTRRILITSVVLAVMLTVALTGCFRADQPQIAGSAAVGSVSLPVGHRDVTWRRKQLSLRTLSRIIRSTRPTYSQTAVVSRPLVIWAARALLPDGVNATTDFERLGEQLFGAVIRGGQSPVDLVSADR